MFKDYFKESAELFLICISFISAQKTSSFCQLSNLLFQSTRWDSNGESTLLEKNSQNNFPIFNIDQITCNSEQRSKIDRMVLDNYRNIEEK